VRFLYPGLNDRDEAKFYAKEFEKFMSVRSAVDAGWEKPEEHIRANQLQVERRMEYLKGLLPTKGRVLEVGCSSGFLLYPIMEKNIECVGVEPSGVFSEYVRKRGIHCYDSVESMCESGAADSKFDIVMHYFVLEHIRKAEAFLSIQMEMLKPGGYLVLEVPHALDALHSLFKISAYNKFIWVVSHRWYFSTASLEFLLRKVAPESDINVSQDQRYDLSNHLIWARDGKPGGMAHFTSVLGVEVENAYRKSLIQAGYGDTLIAIIQKPV
tara:strand:- start:86 stop:892 length:807 start_codon:yes stop_codon:yes gene_type:complete